MAKKISQLTQATEVKSDDVTVIVQDGETKKLPLNMMVTKQDIENKKVAGLAKLDEIEATYENDTYTPTITVKNKSSVKTGEGDEVDYSANVMDGHAKSAILKGCTLTNLAKTTSHNFSQGRTPSYDLLQPLKINTTYTVVINVVSLDASELRLRFGKNKDNYVTYKTITEKGLYKFTMKPSVDFNHFSPFIPSSDFDNGLFAEYNDLMIIEGNYTNVDAPYFEGMQSVKMPVLKTFNTYNIFNPNNTEDIGKYDCLTLDYYPVEIGTKLSTTSLSKATYWSCLYLYDENKTIIQKDVGNANKIESTFTISNSRAKFVRFKCPRDRKHEVILNYGDIKPYEPYAPYKSNILSTSEDVELRGIGSMKDTLDLSTGKLVQRIGEVVLNGNENWVVDSNVFNNTYRFTLTISNMIRKKWHDTSTQEPFVKSNVFKSLDLRVEAHTLDTEHLTGWDDSRVILNINKTKLSENSVNALKTYLQQNPITVQHQLATESIKTVDLMPSGTHPSTTPYCWKNGHIQLSSSGLLPNLEYSVVTSRAGQINQNATMIVKNDKRIFDLEILLAGGLVNTTYQALTLQNQVETGLSKVSLNSETEPDYLLYHMIMKLIEEKAYKLDDLTEKVSVFYLYEKLSDEQFETIYSKLYPFVEEEYIELPEDGEIIEEPIVDEVLEEVENEVVM